MHFLPPINGNELKNYRLIFKQPDAYITLVRAEKAKKTLASQYITTIGSCEYSQSDVTSLYAYFASHLGKLKHFRNKSCIWLKVFFNLVPPRVFQALKCKMAAASKG